MDEAGGELNLRRRPWADGRRTVILVDDDPDTAEMYRLGLEQFGFSVSVKGDGAALFVALKTELPDILVLDWELPGEHGDVILRRLREDCRTVDLPVFMLSNFPASPDGHVDRVFEAGALAWLEKIKTPPQALAAKLTEALGTRRSA